VCDVASAKLQWNENTKSQVVVGNSGFVNYAIRPSRDKGNLTNNKLSRRKHVNETDDSKVRFRD
jgi:hypothetical protein